MDPTLPAVRDNDPAWIRLYQLCPTMIQHGSDLTDPTVLAVPAINQPKPGSIASSGCSNRIYG